MNVQPQQQPAPPALPQWVIDADTLNLQGEHRLLYELLRDFHRAMCKIESRGIFVAV